jgi:hypothetical protein
MLKKSFKCVAMLSLRFKDGRKMDFRGGQGVVTGVDIEYDENGTGDTIVNIEHYEIERGCVSRIVATLPPLVSYDFKNVFYRATSGTRIPDDEESWKLEKEVTRE